MAPYPAFRGAISDISTPVWRHIRHFDASMVPYPTFRRQYGAISDISTPVWRHIRHFNASMASDISMPVWCHIRHFDASMASYPTFRCQYGVTSDISVRNVPRCFGTEVCIDFAVHYAKLDESRYPECYEIAQRSFFGPSGGKSDAADPFLILPGSIFELFVR